MHIEQISQIHPGRILLEEFLAPRGVSVWHLAKDIGIPTRRISEIIQGQKPINLDIAHRLAHYFGMSERYWLDFQARDDGKQANKSPVGFSRNQSLRSDKPRRAAVMDTANTHRPINRTLAVINGGLNCKVDVQDTTTPLKPPKLLDQVRQAIRTRHYSYRTEKAYVHWIKRYIFFHDRRHPVDMAEPEIGRFLTSLATDGHLSASTQNQAFNALLFLYHEILNKKIGLIDSVVRAKRPQRLPVVLTKDEVKKVIDRMNGAPRLMALLLYGVGLRLMECCRLRVKDIDFTRNEIVVRSGKGNKDRYTTLPSTVREPLIAHLKLVKSQHESDLKAGLGRVNLPNALDRKYPNAGKECG